MGLKCGVQTLLIYISGFKFGPMLQQSSIFSSSPFSTPQTPVHTPVYVTQDNPVRGQILSYGQDQSQFMFQ